MSLLPHPSARAALEHFREDVERVFPELVSLIAYGSAIGEHFHEEHSNVNLLLVLPRVDDHVLMRGAEILKQHREKSRIVPLILSEKELRDSLDMFAVEFSDIRERHAVLKGVDIFGGLTIPTTWLRHQCEFELRGKLIRLRQGFLECAGAEKHLPELLVQVLSGVLPLGRSLLRLKGERPPHSRAEQIQALARSYGFEAQAWLEVLELKERRRHQPARPAAQLFRDFLAGLEGLVARVDDAG